ncbi:hypothetical protein WJX81_001401 [Elliptochloris bilobata]|uniref:Kinesin light chain n=1 Tax=Elliptochloris bilobata TaxID=381761 RepID=A0AAW1SKC3_9CHLO
MHATALGAAAGGLAWYLSSETQEGRHTGLLVDRKASDGSVANDYTAQFQIYTQRGAEVARQKKFAAAERLLLAALDMARRGWGDEDEHVGAAQSNLAELYRVMGRADEAEALYHKAIQQLTQACGQADVRTANVMHNLAQHYSWQANHEAAQAWSTKAMDIKRAALGPAHPDTVSTVKLHARCLAAHAGWQEAASVLESYLAKLTAAGQGNSEGAQLLAHSVAAAHFAAGDAEEAVAALRRALAAVSANEAVARADGRDKDAAKLSLEVFQTSLTLVHALEDIVRESVAHAPRRDAHTLLDEAHALMEQCLSTLTVVSGPKSPSVANALAAMSSLSLHKWEYCQATGCDAQPALLQRCINQATSARQIWADILEKVVATLAASQSVPLHARLLGAAAATPLSTEATLQLVEALPAMLTHEFATWVNIAKAQQGLGRLEEAGSNLVEAGVIQSTICTAQAVKVRKALGADDVAGLLALVKELRGNGDEFFQWLCESRALQDVVAAAATKITEKGGKARSYPASPFAKHLAGALARHAAHQCAGA